MDQQQEIILINEYVSSGQLDLLGNLYKPYMPLVYGVCLKYLSSRSLAQDAVMDIFEKLSTDLHKFDTGHVFKTWLYVVTKNHCLMYLRKNSTRDRAFEKMSNELMENAVTPHPIDEAHETDLSPALKICMERLKDKQRQTIELFYFEKRCYKEIADVLEVDEKTVKTAIQNGKRNLKICIEETQQCPTDIFS